MVSVKDLIGTPTATTWEICSNLLWLVDMLLALPATTPSTETSSSVTFMTFVSKDGELCTE